MAAAFQPPSLCGSERFSLCSCALHGHLVPDLAPRSWSPPPCSAWSPARSRVAAPQPPRPNPGGTALVISEVYGGGGNAGRDLHPRLRRALQPHGGADRPLGDACRSSTGPPRAPWRRRRATSPRWPPLARPAGDYFVSRWRAGRRRRRPRSPNVDSSATRHQPERQRRPGLPRRQHDRDRSRGAGDTTITDRASSTSSATATGDSHQATRARPRPRRRRATPPRSRRDADGTDTDVNGADFAARHPVARRLRLHRRRRRSRSPAPSPRSRAPAPTTPYLGDIVTTQRCGHRQATRPAASTASTSRPAAPAGTDATPAPPTRSSCSAAPAAIDRRTPRSATRLDGDRHRVEGGGGPRPDPDHAAQPSVAAVTPAQPAVTACVRWPTRPPTPPARRTRAS